MRTLFWVLGGLVVAVGLTVSSVGTAEAAPLPAAATTMLYDGGSLATTVHCRTYRHCHRRCWWRNGIRRCGSFCHRCG
jgi:hypothetical protein